MTCNFVLSLSLLIVPSPCCALSSCALQTCPCGWRTCYSKRDPPPWRMSCCSCGLTSPFCTGLLGQPRNLSCWHSDCRTRWGYGCHSLDARHLFLVWSTSIHVDVLHHLCGPSSHVHCIYFLRVWEMAVGFVVALIACALYLNIPGWG